MTIRRSGFRRSFAGTRRWSAWYLKEAFQLFWVYTQPWRAQQHLFKWMNSAMRSKLEPFKKFVCMLRSHLDGVLAPAFPTDPLRA